MGHSRVITGHPFVVYNPNHIILNQKETVTAETNPIILQIRKLIPKRSSELPVISQLISIIRDKARITSEFFHFVSLPLYLVALGT